MEHINLFLLAACVFGLWMTWGVGANDLANVMATTMGSKAVTPRQAMIIAIIFEFAGAVLGGGHVTDTMQHGIINTDLLMATPRILNMGMLSVLMACMFWINFASFLGLPVSITNAIVGSMVGFGSLVLGVHAVHWQQIGFIAISWVTAPLIAGGLAYTLFVSIQRLILADKDPVGRAKRYLPAYLFLVGLILASMTVLKGMRHFGLDIGNTNEFLLTLSSGIIVAGIGQTIIKRLPSHNHLSRHQRFVTVEKMFAVLMAMTSCAMVFAHGSNDVAVAVGPITVILSTLQHHHPHHPMLQYPSWITIMGCFSVVAGLLMYGRRVIETVGSGITALTPSRAFAATLAAASAVVLSTSLGIPVSATQTLVGGVLGVGLARGIGALNMAVVRNIFISWIITVPAASTLTIAFYSLLKNVI